jgi:hypothetical protein
LNKRRVGVSAVEVKGKGTRAPHSNASIPREVNAHSNANTLSRFRKESSGLEGITRLDGNGVGACNQSPLETKIPGVESRSPRGTGKHVTFINRCAIQDAVFWSNTTNQPWGSKVCAFKVYKRANPMAEMLDGTAISPLFSGVSVISTRYDHYGIMPGVSYRSLYNDKTSRRSVCYASTFKMEHDYVECTPLRALHRA